MLFQIASYLEIKLLMPLLRLVQILIVALSSISLEYKEYLEQPLVTDGQSFDFVIVGGGTAGCVLAHRLTEISNWTVLLVEAGGDPPLVTENPTLSMFALPSLPDWGYYSVDDSSTSQARRTVHHTMGKMLGGSSSLNYMFHVRGNQLDYDGWADRGNLGWDWGNVEKYFKKSEFVNKVLSSEFRGHSGLTRVTKQVWEQRTGAYLQGFAENGHTALSDYNGQQQVGYSGAQFTVAYGIRQSATVAYLEPAISRSNLRVLTNTMARKVLFDSNKNAIGIEVALSDGKIISVKGKKEIILSAGSANSPQLLMLSGVGPKEYLTKMGIKVIHDSKNVGENLQDHMMVHVILTGKSGFSSVVNNVDALTGWGEFPIPTLIGFVALNKTQTYPDYQTTVCPLPAGNLLVMLICKQFIGLDDETCVKVVSEGNRRETLHALVAILSPASKGQVRLKSKDPNDKPLIYNRYFSNDQDLENFAIYVEDYVSVINTNTFRSFGSKVIDIDIKQCRHLEFGSRAYWKCYIVNTVVSHYHLVGTCAMGPEGEGVVDERLLVRGVGGLRVVDASVMPKITHGNTNAAVLMIAEKASDLIKEGYRTGTTRQVWPEQCSAKTND